MFKNWRPMMAVALTSIALAACSEGATEPKVGPPAALAMRAGDFQNGIVGSALPTALAVAVTDANGAGVPGISVNWVVTSGGGTVSAAQTLTDASGMASTTWTLGRVPGANVVTAGVPGLNPVSFTASATAGPPAAIAITPNPSSAEWGTTVQFNGRVTDAFGNVLSNPVTWSSSNTSVATISATGLASARTRGVTTITAAAGTLSANTTLNVNATNATLTVRNLLTLPITVTVNSSQIGTVNAKSTRDFTIAAPTTLSVRWDVIRQTRSDGVPVGDFMGGTFESTVPSPTQSYRVDHQVGTSFFFAPRMDNRTGTTWLMGVNMGLVSENRCNCTIAPFANNVLLGYYRLFTNTNVRAYRDGSGYTGSFVFWDGFSSSVDSESGEITLFSTTAPTAAPRPGEVRRYFQPVAFQSVVPDRREKLNEYPAEPPILTVAPLKN